MRKKIRKLFIVFGVLICIFALVGCDLIFVDDMFTVKEVMLNGELCDL